MAQRLPSLRLERIARWTVPGDVLDTEASKTCQDFLAQMEENHADS